MPSLSEIFGAPAAPKQKLSFDQIFGAPPSPPPAPFAADVADFLGQYEPPGVPEYAPEPRDQFLAPPPVPEGAMEWEKIAAKQQDEWTNGAVQVDAEPFRLTYERETDPQLKAEYWRDWQNVLQKNETRKSRIDAERAEMQSLGLTPDQYWQKQLYDAEQNSEGLNRLGNAGPMLGLKNAVTAVPSVIAEGVLRGTFADGAVRAINPAMADALKVGRDALFPQAEQAADALARTRADDEAYSQYADSQQGAPSKYARQITEMLTKYVPIGATTGPAGLTPFIFTEAQSGAYAEGKQAGLKGKDLDLYANGIGVINAGFTLVGGKIAQRFGAGTIEEFGMQGVPLSNSFREFLKKYAIGALSETAAEEVPTYLAENYARYAAGISEDAIPENWQQDILDIAVVSTLAQSASSLSHAGDDARQFLENPTPETAKQAGIPDELIQSREDAESLAVQVADEIAEKSTEAAQAPETPVDAIPENPTAGPELPAEVAQEQAQEAELPPEPALPVQTDSAVPPGGEYSPPVEPPRKHDIARTGEPFTATVYRGFRGPQTAGTGTFFAFTPETAMGYLPTVDPKPEQLTESTISLNNPLVIDGGQRRAVLELLGSISNEADRREIANASDVVENAVNDGDMSETGYRELDQLIAKHAQQQGFDGIVYRKPVRSQFGETIDGSEVVVFPPRKRRLGDKKPSSEPIDVPFRVVEETPLPPEPPKTLEQTRAEQEQRLADELGRMGYQIDDQGQVAPSAPPPAPVSRMERKRRLGDKKAPAPVAEVAEQVADFSPVVAPDQAISPNQVTAGVAEQLPPPPAPISRMEQKRREQRVKENERIRKQRLGASPTEGKAWVQNTWRVRRPKGVNTPAEAAAWIEGPESGYDIAPYWKYLEREGITLEEAFAREATPSVAPPDAPPVAPSQVTADSGVGPEVVAPTVVEAPKKKLGQKVEAERPAIFSRNTRGQGVQYHGTSAPNLSPTNDHYSTLNYYGQGFYTTDAVDVAYGYSKRGSKQSGKRGVWKIQEKRPLNLYDAEQPISPEIMAMLEDVAEAQGVLGDSIDQKPANLRELYDDFRDHSRDNGLSADTVQETFDTLAYRLQQMGYDGLQHKGGLRTDTKAHLVKIYFNPEEDIAVSEVVPAEPMPLPSIEEAEKATGKKRLGDKKAEPAKVQEEVLPDWVTDDDFALEAPALAPKQKQELSRIKRRLKAKLDAETFDEIAGMAERDQYNIMSEADRRADWKNEATRQLLDSFDGLQTHEMSKIATRIRNITKSGKKDTASVPGFDELLSDVRDNHPALAAYAESVGNGDVESGLADILMGGRKALEAKLVGPETEAFDVLEEYRERLERSPEEGGGGTVSEESGGWNDGEGSNQESGGGDAPAQADDFQLSREGSKDTSPVVEEYKVAEKDRVPPKKKTQRQPQLVGLPEDLDENVLPGQQGLFSGKSSDAASEELKPKKKLGAKKAGTAELKGAAQTASLPPLKPVTKNQPKTAEGKKLFDKLRADEGKNRVGLRTINDYLMELAHTRLFIGNTQTSKRNPAHYLGKVNSKGRPTGFGPHIIRSRTGYSHLNVHEVGHAISGYLGSLDPRWHKSIAGDLVKLTRMKGSVASANTAEEGWAELVRRYVVLPNSVPKNLYAEFEKTMGKYNPDMLAGLQDAQAAYAYHRSRPVMDQLQSLMYDKGKEKGIGGVVKDQIYRLMFSTIGGDVILHRLYRRGWRGIGGDNAATGYDPTGLISMGRSLVNEAYRERQKLAEGFYNQIKDTPADMESAYQSWLHVPEEAGRAIIGDKKGREGIRIRATGKGLDMLDQESVDLLREAGFYIPDASAKHGDWIYLNNKSFDSIKSAVGKENWQAFETWGQMRAALDRFKKAGHDYPLRGDGLTPELLEQFVKEHQDANPDWDKHFREVNDFMDQLLLVPVLSGEISVGEAIAIKNKWSDYWPLPRQVDGKGFKTGGGGAEPSAGIRSAYGSLLPFRTLTEAVESRVKSAMEAYYTNRMMLAVKNYGDMLDAFNKNMLDPEAKSKEDKKPLASFDARKEAMQLMLPLKMEMKVAAKLSVREQQEIVAKAMNEMAAKELGIPVSELDEETAIQPENVVISTPGKAVWRSTNPRAAHVVRVFENGSPKYCQVPDPLLFDFFAHGQKSPNAYFRTLGILLRGLAAPWKRAITQSIPFALNNAIARDPFTAASLSKAETKKALMPGYFMGVGVVNRITGGNLDAVSQSELLSRSLDQTSSKPHLTRWENFKEMLTEGIIPPNYSDMPWYDKAAAAPGQAMSTILKPADVFNYVTAGRALSKLGEEATREGAYITALREGASDERAQLAYDQITGNFGQRGGNPEVAELIRSAGFLNPALQILWGSAQHPTHYNPAMRARYIAAKLPAIASLSAVAAAVNVLIIKAMHDEDDAEEIFAQMKERKDEDRLSKMAVAGKVGLPFDYGHVGAVQSYAWNAVEGWMLDDPVDPATRAKELLHRATTLPGVADTIPPHVKLWIELGAGETGHSFFYNDDVVPAWLVEKYKNNPELRAYPETPTAYKKVGEWLGVSPMKVRYAVTSGLSREMDAALTTAERPNKDVSDLIVAGRMATKESTGFNSDSVESLMELDYEYAQLKEQAENEPDAGKKAKLEEKLAGLETTHAGAVLVDKVWQAAKEMREEGNIPGYKKAKRVMVGMGRDILGAPPLEGFPDPWRNWGEMPPEIQEAITKYAELRAEEAIIGRGLPDQKDDESDADYKARVKKWEVKREQSTDWMRRHKNAPAVQAAIKAAAAKIPPQPVLGTRIDPRFGAKRAEWKIKYAGARELAKSLE